jgi:hypothetical protein
MIEVLSIKDWIKQGNKQFIPKSYTPLVESGSPIISRVTRIKDGYEFYLHEKVAFKGEVITICFFRYNHITILSECAVNIPINEIHKLT